MQDPARDTDRSPYLRTSGMPPSMVTRNPAPQIETSRDVAAMGMPNTSAPKGSSRTSCVWMQISTSIR